MPFVSFTSSKDYTIDILLLQRKNIFEATITHLGVKNFEVQIFEWIKVEREEMAKCKFRVNYSWLKPVISKEEFGLEMNRRYLFMISGTEKEKEKFRLTSPESRLIVENDSICIPFELIDNYKFSKKIEALTLSPIPDPIFTIGYKISRTEFIELIYIINSTYEYGNTGCIIQKLAPVENLDDFRQTILDHLNVVKYENVCD